MPTTDSHTLLNRKTTIIQKRYLNQVISSSYLPPIVLVGVEPKHDVIFLRYTMPALYSCGTLIRIFQLNIMDHYIGHTPLIPVWNNQYEVMQGSRHYTTLNAIKHFENFLIGEAIREYNFWKSSDILNEETLIPLTRSIYYQHTDHALRITR